MVVNMFLMGESFVLADRTKSSEKIKLKIASTLDKEIKIHM